MECIPCGKKFSGLVCYEQHMESEKHKKKVISASLLKSQSDASLDNTHFEIDPKHKAISCAACDMLFDSIENFQCHSLTREHGEKIMSGNPKGSSSCNAVSSSNDTQDENKSADKNDTILPQFQENKTLQFLSFSTCHVCNKQFSGPEPYKQHQESALHLKNVELQKSPNQNTAFSCEPCKKTFSGQIPYNQHMTSEIHKKKLQNLKFLDKYISEVDSSRMPALKQENNSETDNNRPWFCSICSVHCSGFAPYEQHLAGSAHIKNVNRAKLQNAASPSGNSVQPTMQYCNNVENGILLKTVNMPQIANGSTTTTTLNNQKIETDFLLEELVQNLDVMSTEELEKSIKIFLPDENVDFDISKENKMQTDSANENVTENKMHTYSANGNAACNFSAEIEVQERQMNEVELDPKVYQVCEYCNVELRSTMDIASHYESVDHFVKRWHTN